MKAICAFFVFLCVTACATTKTLTDEDILKGIIGTWTEDPSEHALLHDRSTYNADGSGVEFVWPAGKPESTAVRIDTVWAVTNQLLILTSVKSSNTQVLPIGLEVRDHVVSMSPDQFVIEPASGYEGRDIEKKRHVKIRLKSDVKQ